MNKTERTNCGTPAACSELSVDWTILYEDADRVPEMFTDEAVARATFAERKVAWSCHLFRRAIGEKQASTPPAPAAGSDRPLARRAADALAYECAKAVRSGRLDARSGIADALLDYLDVGEFGGPIDVPSWMLDYKRQNGN